MDLRQSGLLQICHTRRWSNPRSMTTLLMVCSQVCILHLLMQGTQAPQEARQSWVSIRTSCSSSLFDAFSASYRRRTNVQQLTCKIDLSNYFYYLFFSFVLLELKPFVLKGKVRGEKLWKSVKKCENCENCETILPFSFCPSVFPWSYSVFEWLTSVSSHGSAEHTSRIGSFHSAINPTDLTPVDYNWPIVSTSLEPWNF